MRYLIAAIALAVAGAISVVQAAEVRLNGATTVVSALVAPLKPAVEKATGHTLVIVGNATGRGLVDLVDGKCDLAMVSEPLNIAVEAAAVAGKVIDPTKLVLTVVKTDEIVFIVNKANPVRKLSWAEIRDIHAGRISNWKEVGGKDAPIVVYSDALTGGTRAMIKHTVMEGQEFGPAVKPQAAVKKAAELVAGDENGFAGVGKGFVDVEKAAIVSARKLERPLGFVTLGKPAGDAAAVISAFQSEAGK